MIRPTRNTPDMVDLLWSSDRDHKASRQSPPSRFHEPGTAASSLTPSLGHSRSRRITELLADQLMCSATFRDAHRHPHAVNLACSTAVSRSADRSRRRLPPLSRLWDKPLNLGP